MDILTTTPDTSDLKYIHSYDTLNQLTILKDICNRIYIARNISLSHESVLENLNKIDILFKDNENYN